MEEKKLKIQAVQMSSVLGDKHANFEKVKLLVDEYYQEGADVIVLPEVWTVGWKPSLFCDNAESLIGGETVDFLSALAKEYDVNIIGGSFITKAASGNFYNTCPIFNKSGELVAHYNKMHLFSYYGCDEGKYVSRGKKPVIVDVNGVKIGLSICYDIRFPELYRAYRKAGADLLINMAAWPLGRAIHWESLSRARAVENQSFMLALTQSGLIEGEEYNLGHSRIIGFNGDTVTEIKEGEGVISAELKFNEMYQFREKCTVLLDIQESYDVR